MKILLPCIAIVLLLIACKTNKNPELQVENPLPMPLGDPFLLNSSIDSTFYMYGTSENLNGFKAYASKDLNNWEDRGIVYDSSQDSTWGENCFWAPEVYERDGKFYLWYSANWKHNPTNEAENFRIGVAVSDSPTGPFKDMHAQPVFDPGYPIIDANLYFNDEAGKVYLYYSRCCYIHAVDSEISEWAIAKGWYEEIEESWIYGVELKPDFSGVIGQPVLLLQPPSQLNDAQSEWESRSVTSREVNRRWNEGSFLFKEANTYYMMYSANFFGGQNYAVGYATATNPLGPYVKSPNNPVLQRKAGTAGEVTGTGHNMVLTLPNKQRLCVYHGRTDSSGDQRIVFINQLHISADGQLSVEGPTIDKRPKESDKTE